MEICNLSLGSYTGMKMKNAAQHNTRFWHSGIRFTCQGCGNCCRPHGPYGYVYVNKEDRQRLARFLGVRTSSFTRKHCAQSDGYYHLKRPDLPCGFLKNHHCSVHAARPLQCRAWPFWRESMDARTWYREVDAFCPGVGKGKRHRREQIQALLDQQDAAPDD